MTFQLPLTVAMAAVLAGSLSSPETPGAEPGLWSACVVQLALVLVCILGPWPRLRPAATLAIPALDLLAIGLTAMLIPGVGVFSIFPVAWLSGFIGMQLTMDRVRARIRQERARGGAREAQLRSSLARSRDQERFLRSVLDSADVGIAAVDTAGRRLLTNQWQTALEDSAAPAGVAPRAAGAAGAEECHLRLTALDQASPLPADRRPLHRAATGESFAGYLVRFGDARTGRVVSAGARPLTGADGGPAGAVVVFTEVTGLVEALAAKDDVVSTVSHEFRTPLTSIIGNLDLVLGDSRDLSAGTLRRVEVAQRNAERLLALVSDLLMAANPTGVQPRRTNLAGLVQASLGSAQTQADGSRVRLSMDLPDPLWATVDPLRIGQALDNLISNAIKYSPEGGPVHVSGNAEAGRVLLHVQDSGMGMTASDADRVFTRFFRSPAVRESLIPGAGLGLSITKAILERHGGSISCTTRPGHGSTFTLELPSDGAPPAF